MEIVESESSPKQHVWLKWMGIQEPPLEADSWVPVVRGLQDLGAEPSAPDSSVVGARLVKALADAGIEARQRSYQFDESYVRLMGGGGGAMETHVAVLVHERDHRRAVEVAAEFNRTLVPGSPVSDEELTRQALEATQPDA